MVARYGIPSIWNFRQIWIMMEKSYMNWMSDTHRDDVMQNKATMGLTAHMKAVDVQLIQGGH